MTSSETNDGYVRVPGCPCCGESPGEVSEEDTDPVHACPDDDCPVETFNVARLNDGDRWQETDSARPKGFWANDFAGEEGGDGA